MVDSQIYQISSFGKYLQTKKPPNSPDVACLMSLLKTFYAFICTCLLYCLNIIFQISWYMHVFCLKHSLLLIGDCVKVGKTLLLIGDYAQVGKTSLLIGDYAQVGKTLLLIGDCVKVGKTLLLIGDCAKVGKTLLLI